MRRLVPFALVALVAPVASAEPSQCLGLQADCTYSPSGTDCCAPMACLCANGYCRCGTSGASNDDGTESGGCGDAYTPGGALDGCLNQFYDPATYNWLALQNTCGEAIHVVHVSATPGLDGASDLAPGQKSSTGWSRQEIDAHGSLSFAICPAGSTPVDASGKYWNGGQYRCRKDGAEACRRREPAPTNAPPPPKTLEFKPVAPATVTPVRPSSSSPTRSPSSSPSDVAERQREARQRQLDEEIRQKQLALERARQRAAADEKRANDFHAASQRSLETNDGMAISNELAAQQMNLAAIAEQGGNSQAAQLIRQNAQQSMANAQLATSIAQGAGDLLGIVFDAMNRAEEREEEEQRQKAAEEERRQAIAEAQAELDRKKAEAAAEEARLKAELARAEHDRLTATLKSADTPPPAPLPMQLKPAGKDELALKSIGEAPAASGGLALKPVGGGADGADVVLDWKAVGAAEEHRRASCDACRDRCDGPKKRCEAGHEADCHRAVACACRCRAEAGGCGLSERVLGECVTTQNAALAKLVGRGTAP